MIYDSKEVLMDINGRLYVSEDGHQVLQRYEIDYDGLEEGKRYLAIPDGITEISDTAFSEYNSSELMLFGKRQKAGILTQNKSRTFCPT